MSPNRLFDLLVLGASIVIMAIAPFLLVIFFMPVIDWLTAVVPAHPLVGWLIVVGCIDAICLLYGRSELRGSTLPFYSFPTGGVRVDPRSADR